MRILGIDPGTRYIGYGVIDLLGSQIQPVACGLIRTDTKKPLNFRLKQIHENLLVILDRCNPDVTAVEQVFYGCNVATLIKIGEARGVILAANALKGIETFGYSPAEVKKAVTGNGRASKSQVQEMVKHLLGAELIFETEDVSDALAIAVCHANRSKMIH